mgnify:FL=1
MFDKQGPVARAASQTMVLVAIVVLVAPLFLIVRMSVGGEGPANYLRVLSTTPFLRFLINSAVVALTTVLLVLVLAVCAAYSLARLRPRGSGVLSGLIMAGLTVPAIALVVPIYSLVDRAGLFDTYWAVIVPLTALSIPFGVLVGSNYIRAIPREVFEAAMLDGASDLRILVSVVVPISRPLLSVIAVFTFLAAWNEYLLPLLFLQDVDLKVVTQIPTYFQSQRLVDTPKIFAANVLISVPIVLFYLFLQNTFRKGLSSGAVK